MDYENDKQTNRGFQGALIKLFNAPDFTLTVLEKEQINPYYYRIKFSVGDLFEQKEYFPTMWVRLWFPKALQSAADDLTEIEKQGGKYVQRGFTIIDPDIVNKTAYIEFSIHAGRSSYWAQQVSIGGTIAGNFLGSVFAPRKFNFIPQQWLIVGDMTSLPAIKAMLQYRNSLRKFTPVLIWLEYQHEEEKICHISKFLSDQDELYWIPRTAKGAKIISTVTQQAEQDAKAKKYDNPFVWISLEAKATRAITKTAKTYWNTNKHYVSHLAYWLERKNKAQILKLSN